DGSAQSIRDLRLNITRADVVGSLVANDYRSSMIVIPLVGQGADGKPVDYKVLADAIEDIRQKYINSPEHDVNIYIIGFAKLTGDLINGLHQVMLFFLAAAIVAVVIIYSYTRCIRSSLLVLSCSIVAVVWQLGAVT